jgi:hypothetical protein
MTAIPGQYTPEDGRVRRYGRSPAQRAQVADLLNGYDVRYPDLELRGSATRYAMKYRTAFEEMRRRMEADGYMFRAVSGPRGGRNAIELWHFGVEQAS